MKQFKLKLAILLGAPILLTNVLLAQNNQPLPEFDKINLDGRAKVELIIADRNSIYSDGIFTDQPEVRNGVLYINNGTKNGEVIKVYTKSISSIKLDGQAKLGCTDSIKSNDLIIDMDGASKAELVVAAKNLRVDIDGAANLYVSGTAEFLSAETDGAAKLSGDKLVATQANINTDGASSANVFVTSNLIAKADGASSIRFSGNPANKSFSMDGLSSIKDLTNNETFNDNNDKNNDTTKVSVGKYKFLILEDDTKEKSQTKPRREMKSVYKGFEWGLNALTTEDMNFSHDTLYNYLNTNLGRSWFFGLNLFEFDAQIIKNKVALTTGLGMQWSNYHFDDNRYITPKIESLGATNAGLSLNKNKLYTFDLNAPFLIKFAPGSKRSDKKGMHIATGLIVRYVATARVFTETTANGYKQKTRIQDDFNINPIKVDATVRVGFNKVNVFATYALTPYFNNNKAPDIRTFAAGITLVGF